jgi:transcriptional regulator with XRE-family HTH domain
MVGKMVKAYLKAKGISQSFVARKINMPRNVFNNRVNEGSEFTAEELYAVAEALDVPLETFRPKEGSST